VLHETCLAAGFTGLPSQWQRREQSEAALEVLLKKLLPVMAVNRCCLKVGFISANFVYITP
jgi:hypothetical protein